MIEFEPLYRRFGFNKLSHFQSPTVIKTDSFVFPFNSELHYFKVTEEPMSIRQSDMILKSQEKLFCKTLFGYGTDEVVGKFIRKPLQPLKLIKSIAVDPNIRYLLPSQEHITIPRRAVVVYNYTTCQCGFEYYRSLRRKLWKYENLTKALVNKTSQTLRSKNVFITFELPNKLTTREKMDVFSKNLTPQRIRAIDDYRFYNILALWKFITPSFKEQSWLSNWKQEDRIRINLLLMKDNSMVLLNLGLLEQIIKEYGESNKNITLEDIYGLFTGSLEDAKMISKGTLKADMARKNMLLFLNNVINKPLKTQDVSKIIESPEKFDKELKEYENQQDHDFNLDIDIDELLSKELTDELKEDEELLQEVDENGDPIEFDEDENEAEYNVTNKTEYKSYSNLDSLYKDKDKDGMNKLKDQIDILREEGQINKTKENSLKNLVNSQSDKTFRIQNQDIPLDKILDVDSDLGQIETKNAPVTDIPSVFDKSYNQNKIKSLDKQYLDEFMVKDGVRVAYSLQNNGYIVEDYKIEETSSILDTTQLHTIKVKSIEGKSSTLRFFLPKIDEDGSFKMSGNTYRIRKQRFETPIRKINSKRVCLTSYYGKVFIDKAYKKTFHYGYWFLRQLLKNPEVENIVDGEIDYPDIKVNKLYGMLSKAIKSFIYGGCLFSFDYYTRTLGLDEKVVRDLESHGIIVGRMIDNDDIVLVMDNVDYKIYKVSVKSNSQSYFITLFDLIGTKDITEGPIEFGAMKLHGDHIPVVIPLSYYIGLENLLKLLGCQYFIDYKDQDSAERKKSLDPELKAKMIKVKFLDADLYYLRNMGLSDVVIGGLFGYSKIVRETSFSSWNSRQAFPVIYAYFQYSPAIQVEINIMENMFIDPMTLSLLKTLKEPETFKGLILKACELMIDDNYTHPNDISGQIIKGYERLNGMVYNALSRALVKTEIESIFTASKITLDPYEVMKQIKDDSTTVNVDDLNPLATIKQGEDLSYLGLFGRNVITMTKKTRAIHPSEIGVVSESVKDNGQVGVTAYLSANPNIVNLRGKVEAINAEESGWGDIFSTSGLLTQWGDRDDMKRLNFSAIQGAHVVPINEMRAPVIRTGYESIVPLRSSDKFCISAKMEGKVINLTNKYMEVEYTDGKIDKYPIKTWTTKEEAGYCYTHRLVPNFQVGESFKKDDSLLYNPSFFEPDIFYPGRVIYKQGTLVNVAIVDDPETYEDSGAISHKLKQRLGITTTKVISIVIDKNDEVQDFVKIGQKVEPTDILFTFMDKDAMSLSKDEAKLDSDALSLLRGLRSSSPKAKVRGKVSDVILYYNLEEISEATDSVVELIMDSDKRLKLNKGYPGKVNSSYSIRGVPLEKGKIEIKVYIEVNEEMGTGDKAIFCNQIKFTVGDIFDNDVTTEDGREVEALFGYTSIQNRIVNSPILVGSTAALLEEIEKQAIELYFKP